MSGRNFGESGDFGSGENLLGVFGSGKFLLDLIIFARNINFRILSIFSHFRIFVDCRVGWILGHLGGVRAWFVVQGGVHELRLCCSGWSLEAGWPTKGKRSILFWVLVEGRGSFALRMHLPEVRKGVKLAQGRPPS